MGSKIGTTGHETCAGVEDEDKDPEHISYGGQKTDTSVTASREKRWTATAITRLLSSTPCIVTPRRQTVRWRSHDPESAKR